MKPKLIPKYIPMKATENKTVVVPQYYPKEIEPKPIKEKPVPVEMPPEVVKVYDHIKVPCVSAMHFVIIVIIGKGCARTTLSPLKCDAVCTHAGESVSCMERIHWTKQNVFQGRGNACALAYSKVQVECSICRGCSIEEAGCTVNVATSAAFDCNAALSNFFRAWSPSKKQWCCTQEGKGCEGNSPPHVDPGFGMVWKHVQVHGYWTWQAVGGGHVKLPYDCHAGLANFQIGWSSGKRAWCCSKQHLGCGAVGGAASAAGGFAAGAAGATGGEFVHHTTVVMDHAAHGNPPAMAARGMMWHWAHSGGHWHWVQIHAGGHLPFDCEAGFAKWQTGWSGSKKQWCCQNMGKGCQ
ncbi:Insulin-degrading enzyme [Durusdinium trenchii]|uniref:Insulin-degrading enzyme n=1 Tax=Durusdinium trenchii TaxID=1381693 RepID=A0ABP0M906_9DINO